MGGLARIRVVRNVLWAIFERDYSASGPIVFHFPFLIIPSHVCIDSRRTAEAVP